ARETFLQILAQQWIGNSPGPVGRQWSTKIADEQLIQNYPERIDVRASRSELASEKLRRHVEMSPCLRGRTGRQHRLGEAHPRHTRQGFLRDHLPDAEIRQLDFQFGI